jgi:putative nucleotidyltransferase with HDIG domain
LRQLNFTHIKVQLPAADAAQVVAQYQQQYVACLEKMDALFSLASTGRQLSAEQVEEATSTVLERTNAGGDLYFRAESPQLPPTTGKLQVHSLNTAMIASFLHQWMEQDAALLPVTIQGALLHDIGKTQLKPYLLDLSGPLSQQEEIQWKRHPRDGWEQLQKCKGLHPLVGVLVAMHHEKPDGSGYPMGLRNGNIHPLARIIAAADRFDNLTSGHARERSCNPFQAFEQLRREGADGFHPTELNALLEHIPAHYVGERFFLSNGDIGEVLHINKEALGCPLVRTTKGFLDLSKDTSIHIEAMV